MADVTLKAILLGEDRSASKALKGVGGQADNAGGKLKGFGKAAGTAAKVGALALGAMAVAAGAALFGMAKAAMADEKSQAVLAKQLKNSAGATKEQIAATEDWITAQGKALGVTDDELRPALSKLAAATKSVGEAQGLTSIAMDVSAGTGKSLSTVSAALAKAQLGNVAGLAKLGVETKNADGSTRSLRDITIDLAKTYEGQAATAANTTEGKFGRLKLMFDETKESIGSKLLPVLSDMASWFLKEGLPAIQRFGGWLSDNFGPILGQIVGWFKDKLIPALMSAYKQALPGLRSALESVKKGIHNMQPMLSFLADLFVKVLLPVLGQVAKTVLPLLGKAFEAVGKAVGLLGEVGRWLWNSVFQPVFKFIVQGVANVLDWFGRMLEKIGKVPGFGWVGRLGSDIRDVADGAQRVADNLKKIPSKKHVQITIDAHVNAASISGHYAGVVEGLPALASGGIVTRPTVALIGEAGPEAVIPLSRGRGAGMGSSGDVHITINGALDPIAVGKQVQQALLKVKRSNGNAALGLA